MTVHVDPATVQSIAADCATRARALAVNMAIFSNRHGAELEDVLRATGDRTAVRSGAAVVRRFALGADWDADVRRDVRQVTRALYRVAGRRGAVRERAAWLRDRLLELEAQEVRLRTLRELSGLISRRRTIWPPQDMQRRR